MQSRCTGRTGNSTLQATSQGLPLHWNLPCFAKLAVRRHTILKEGLTVVTAHGSRSIRCVKSCGNSMTHGIFGGDSAPVLRFRSSPLDVPDDASPMTFLSTAQQIARSSSQDPRGHIVAIALASAVTAGAIALIAYLLWPTWGPDASNSPARLPVSIGSTLFNVPTAAIRMKIQRHSGPQERVDLNFSFPSLEAPEAQKRVSASSVDEVQPIDRIFLS